MAFKQKLALWLIRTKFKILSSISKKKAAAEAFQLFCTPQFRSVKELPPVFQQAESLQVKFREFTLAGYRWNTGAGQRALIVHGFESSAVNFDQYVPVLTEKGYEVLAFDAPAHGRSTGRQVNALIYADLIRFIYDNHGPINTFVCHSFGGLVTCLALSGIEHDPSCKIVLIAPATETRTAIDQFYQLTAIRDPEVQAEFEKIIVQIGGQPLSWYSIPHSLKKIQAQVLWIHDEDDQVTPLADVHKLRNDNPGYIRFVITKGLGHRRIYRDAGVLDTVREFV